MEAPRLPSHLYVHVPFCASKCSYCDFASISGASDDIVRTVFTGIRTQLTTWSRSALDGVLDTVYVGGGTPSRYPEKVAEVFGRVRAEFVVHPHAEVTVEANPDSLDSEVAELFSAAGVTRISVGVQSFDDSVLRLLGRRHDAAEAWAACRAVVDAGIELSVDVICGVPGQTITSWSETLERVVSTGAHHISVYPLSIEKGTPLSVAVSGGLVADVDPDAAADMMLLASNVLGYHGFGRYEVANYAVDPAHESVHNTAYWTGRPYIGVGPGAHGMLDAATARAVGMLDMGREDVARVRFGNAGDIDSWLTGKGDSYETLTSEEAVREDVMLGLRLARGVGVGQVEQAGLTDVLESLAADGLVEIAAPMGSGGPRWRTTNRGWLLGNVVFGRVWAGE
jgi:oxygen-independent coproporphyrinogen-3 oxidase